MAYSRVKRVDGAWSNNYHLPEHVRVNCYPLKGVVKTTPSERAIGRFTSVRTEHLPKGDAQVDLVSDIFYSLLKNNPEFKDELPVGREINKLLVEWAMENPDFEKARWSTVANLPVATTSAGLLWELLVTDETLQEALKKQERADELMSQAQNYYRASAEETSKGHGESEEVKAMLDEAKKREQQAQAMMKEAADKIEKLKNHPIGQGMMSSIMQQTAEEAKDTAEIMKSWGLEPGNMSAHDSEAIMSIMSANKEHINKISKLIGRFKDISSSAIERTKQSYVGPVSEPAATKDLLKLFPTERAYLSQYSPPYLRATKIVQLARSGLLGWRQKSEAKREGGIKVMVDGSGSMNGFQEIIAKGISLGLAKALKEDSRPYHLLTFGTRRDGFIEVTSEDDWSKHIKWAVSSPGGGTEFTYAFEKAIEEVRKSHKVGKHGHDVLFITDGWSDLRREVAQEWVKCRAETGSKLVYIDIAGSVNQTVRDLADIYVRVDSVYELDKIADKLVVDITELVARQR